MDERDDEEEEEEEDEEELLCWLFGDIDVNEASS